MKYFVVQMTCNPGRAQDVMIYAGEHIKWMLEHIPKKMFVAAGPFVNEKGEFDDGLCIVKAESKESLEEVLKTDPFYTRGIRNFTIRQWEYLVDEFGYRIDFPPHLAEQWGIPQTLTKLRLSTYDTFQYTKHFIVQMTCNEGRAQDVMIHAGPHIKWVLENLPKRMFIAAGAYINEQGAFDDGLCIMKAESKNALEEVLKTDPFYTRGIRNFTVREWDYHVDEGGYRIDFPPHLAQAWGVTSTPTKERIA